MIPSGQITDVHTLVRNSREEFDRALEQHIRQGWMPFGGLSMTVPFNIGVSIPIQQHLQGQHQQPTINTHESQVIFGIILIKYKE